MSAGDDELAVLGRILRAHRWAALATLGARGPEVSWVAYAFEEHFGGFLLHLSRLAAHTRYLLDDGRASLGVSAQEGPGIDPQTLPRAMIHGSVAAIDRDAPGYAEAAARYRQRLPESEATFALDDFVLFRLRPRRIRFVAGLGRVHTLAPAALARAWSASEAP